MQYKFMQPVLDLHNSHKLISHINLLFYSIIFSYLAVVVEDIDDEGASDRGACPLSEEDSDSMAFAGGEVDKTQQGDRVLAPQIHSCSHVQVVLRGPCAERADDHGEGGREDTLLGGDSQAYDVVAPCSHSASCEESCDHHHSLQEHHNQDQNGNEVLPLYWWNGNETLHLYWWEWGEISCSVSPETASVICQHFLQQCAAVLEQSKAHLQDSETENEHAEMYTRTVYNL